MDEEDRHFRNAVLAMWWAVCALVILAVALVVTTEGETLEDWEEISERMDMTNMTAEERAYLAGPCYNFRVTRDRLLVLDDGTVDLASLEVL